jgi:hypothetical protein
MQLKVLISIEYKEKARNKPTFIIRNYVNMLRVFLPSFSRNMHQTPLPRSIKDSQDHKKYLSFCLAAVVYGVSSPDPMLRFIPPFS